MRGSGTMKTLSVHPYADLLPLLPESEFAELKADIEKRDQREAILVKSGYILDGRRWNACAQQRG
jgi:hypothetical protein